MADQIFIEGLALDAFIGVFDHEYKATQRVSIDLVIDILPLEESEDYTTSNIVRYDFVVRDIRALIKSGHIELVETMAENIADIVLGYDGVSKVAIKVSKLSAITEADGVGIKIVRVKQPFDNI